MSRGKFKGFYSNPTKNKNIKNVMTRVLKSFPTKYKHLLLGNSHQTLVAHQALGLWLAHQIWVKFFGLNSLNSLWQVRISDISQNG